MIGLKSESDEMLALDLLRFVAACGVVSLHYGTEYLKQIGLSNFANRLDFLNLAVDIFFVISGFVIAYVYSDRLCSFSDYGKFLWRRVTRLVPLHWATLAFFVLAGLAITVIGIETSSPETFHWPDLLEVALLLHMFGGVEGAAFNYPAWSISAEILMYIMFPLFLLIGRNRYGLPSLVLIVFVWLAIRDLGFYEEKSLLVPDTIRALAGFPLGIIVYSFTRNRTFDGIFYFRIFIIFLLIFCLLGFLEFQSIALLPIAYACAIFAAASDRGRFRPVWLRKLAPLGVLTYSIYMLHVPVKTAMSYLSNLLGYSFDGSILWLTATIFVLFGSSWISYFFFETPLRSFLNRAIKK